MGLNMTESLKLPSFFPYQLTQLQVKVSNAIADIYTGKFDLSRQEWRILATLGESTQLSAKQLGQQTNLEKMPASRAINKMLKQDLIAKSLDKSDKRSSLLTLSNDGKALYQRLAPLAKKREQELLSVLDNKELEQLNVLLAKLEQQADLILKHQK